MLSSVLIVNLGTHDIRIKKDKIDELKEVFKEDNNMLTILNNAKKDNFTDNYYVNNELRYFSNKMNEIFPKAIDTIEFPIIKKVINNIKSYLGKDKLDKIILISTNQENQSYQKQDTCYLSNLINKVNKKFPKELGIEGFNGGIKMNEYVIKEKNPSDYDVMMTEYEKIVSQNRNYDKFYIAITAGTPAMSLALVHNSSEICKGEIEPLYLSKEDDMICKFQISRTLRKNSIKKQIKSLLNIQEYIAANLLLKSSLSNYCNEIQKLETISKLIMCAQNRIEFNFIESQKIIENIYACTPNSRSIAGRFNSTLKLLQSQDSNGRIYLLNELKNNALYKYRNGAYADFLGRIFRLEEDICRFLLEKRNLISSDGKLIKESLTDEQVNLLDNVFIDSKPLKYKEGSLTIDAMLEIFKVVIDENSEEFKIISFCKKFNKLKNYRNNSILAHGYKSISKEMIDENFDVSDLDELIHQVAIFNKIKINDDDFYKAEGNFNQHIISLIDEL